jgi:hypothetical protein
VSHSRHVQGHALTFSSLPLHSHFLPPALDPNDTTTARAAEPTGVCFVFRSNVDLLFKFRVLVFSVLLDSLPRPQRARLLDALQLALPQFSNVPTLPPRSLGPDSTFSCSFRRYLKTRCAYAHLVNFAWRRRSSGVLRRLAGLLYAGGPARLAGTTTSPIRPHGVGRTSPIAILINAILTELNGMRLLGPAALLGDLVNIIDANPFGGLFEAP